MTEPVIRSMEDGDIPFIVAWMLTDPLWRRYGLDAGRIRAELGEALERDDLLLVADGDRPARGFAWCLPNGMFGSQPYLKRLGVDPAFAGRTLGGLLLTEVERLLRAEHSRMLFLLVSDFNLEAQRFYRRHGYDQVGAIPEFAIPGVTELLFSKELGTLA